MAKAIRTLFPRLLDAIERVGNRLPHPATLFLILAAVVALLSWIGSRVGLGATHPIAGLAAAFCGVSGGFGANFLIGSIDPVLAGLSQSAAQIIDPTKTVNPTVNFYFMFVSAILVVILGTWITERIVEPRLGRYTGSAEPIPLDAISPAEKRGLVWAGAGLAAILVLLALSVVPAGGLLRNPSSGELLRSPFFHGIVTAIVLFFLVPGLVYGVVVGKIRNDKDVMKQIVQSMSGMGTYIVLVFFAAQFVAFFRYSNLGIILAIDGATGLRAIGLTGIPLLLCFVALSAIINLFMGSASAKWAIMAPVFVPMFMLLGYDPALTQAAFRIGDSITNPITPMMSYFALIVAFAQKYDERYGVGTIIATMVPYTVIFGLAWSLLLVVWMALGLPLGPGGPLHLPAAS